MLSGGPSRAVLHSRTENPPVGSSTLRCSFKGAAYWSSAARRQPAWSVAIGGRFARMFAARTQPHLDPSWEGLASLRATAAPTLYVHQAVNDPSDSRNWYGPDPCISLCRFR